MTEDTITSQHEENLKKETPIKNFATYIKDYVPIPDFTHRTLASISILIPFVFLSMGAAYQINYLSDIGVEYIRFFSLTQLLSDSIIILLTFFKGGFILFILGILITSISLYYLRKKITTDQSFFFILFIIVVFGSISQIFKNQLIDLASSFSTLFTLIASVITSLLLEFIRIVPIKLIINSTSSKILKDYSGIISSILKLIFGGYIIIRLLSVLYIQNNLKINNSFFPKNNFINYDVIHKKYKAKGLRDSLLYFNDQYIFIQIKKDTIESEHDSIPKIQILKFEEFFKTD